MAKEGDPGGHQGAQVTRRPWRSSRDKCSEFINSTKKNKQKERTTQAVAKEKTVKSTDGERVVLQHLRHEKRIGKKSRERLSFE